MKLFYSVASPYARKALVLAAETGQSLETIDAHASPINRDGRIVEKNPTGKIPTLILPEGDALYDSRVICRYLDAQHGSTRMYPEGDALWTVLRREALADGLMDAALLARYEVALRPEERQWPEWLEGQLAKISSSLDQMEQEARGFQDVDAGLIAIACALGYLDFRFYDMNWRAGRPRLSEWFETFASRDSMVATVPH